MFRAPQSIETQKQESKAIAYSIPQPDFALFIAYVYAMADNTEEFNFYQPFMRESSVAQKPDNELHLERTTVCHPKTSFSYDADEVMVGVSPVDGGSQRYVPALLEHRVLRFYHLSHMSRPPACDQDTVHETVVY